MLVKIILMVLLFSNFVFGVNQILLENFENVSKFYRNTAAKAKMSLSSVRGVKDRAVRIDFDLNEDHYVQIGMPLNINLDEVDELVWYLKGDANGCVIEIKFVDEDGSNFGKKIPISSISKNRWKKFILPLKECHYMWGGDNKIDKIKELWIAFSRGLAKKAYVIIDELGYTEKSSGEPYFEIQLNQLGYHPTDKKFFVVRVMGIKRNRKVFGTFKVKNSKEDKTILLGKLIRTDFKDWEGIFLIGDFSKLRKEGKYFIEIKLKTPRGRYSKKSYPFEINQKILSTNTINKQLTYLKYQRCGIRCHKKDPVMGGYHDTLFDISKRMWSIPFLVYGMARYVQDAPFHPDVNDDNVPDDLDELRWGLKFITEIPEPDGTVSWGGIEADFKRFMSYEQYIARLGPLKPEDDKLPRIKYKDKNLYSTSFNLVALLNSIPAVKDEKLAKKAERVAFKAWKWIDKQRLDEARSYGAYLWAATELYKYTQDKKYLHKIDEIVPKLLKLQALNYKKFENNACGDFYTSEDIKDFRWQYKYISFNIAINLALINLCKILPQDNPLWFDIYYANRVFGESYLKGISSATPYKQIAQGLELDLNGKYRLNYFAGPEAKLAAADNHGLNCDHLGMAYIAMKWGQYIGDLELEEFADNQVNWVLGANPLGYCMLIGVGGKNPVIMAEYFGKPKLDGIIPNGIVGGENEEPEWWGDGPSSGEDWLPHNAAYLAAISVLDNLAELQGKIINARNVVPNANIKILYNRKIVKQLKSNKEGEFGPVKLEPQKKYKIIVEKGENKIIQDINLLSGDKKSLIFNFKQNYELKIKKTGKISENRKSVFKVFIKNRGMEKRSVEYNIRIRGAKIFSATQGEVKVAAGKTKIVKVILSPTGVEPLLLRFEIKGTPIIYKELYLTL